TGPKVHNGDGLLGHGPVLVTTQNRPSNDHPFPSWPYPLSSSLVLSPMESLSMILSCSPPLQNHLKTQKPVTSGPISLPQNSTSISIVASQPFNSSQLHFPSTKNNLQSQSSKSVQNPSLILKTSPFSQGLTRNQLYFLLTELITTTAFTLPGFASEAALSSTEQVSDRINLEAILVSIDDFFNRNPFFVAGCTFVWLVVIPLVQEYLRKYKFVLVIDAFRKLRDDPNVQLLDIRDEKSLKYLKSPNLKILNKATVQVPFSEDDEDGFCEKGFGEVWEPSRHCPLFDGISIKVAELLFKNGFKEAYAIKGGVGGTKGWLESQETLLPPSMHIYPKKKVETSQKTGMNGGVVRAMKTAMVLPLLEYPDLKPPSSPTPSKP
ncbi:Rhodanese/Cell cycle control phosphatase superfamily protein, partial [Prunus dulcis]